jgi:ADP-ribose pyrophosphatase YjhB (NUDIX family)
MQSEHGVPRPTCLACGFIHYRNPVPAAGVLLVSQGSLLMVRRKFEPRAGSWCLPAGFMEFGETPEQCAVRELYEETGIHGRLTRLFNVYAGTYDTNKHSILILYVGELAGGTLAPGDDAIEAGFFSLASLPQSIAFHSHTRALAEYRAELEGGTAPIARP